MVSKNDLSALKVNPTKTLAKAEINNLSSLKNAA